MAEKKMKKIGIPKKVDTLLKETRRHRRNIPKFKKIQEYLIEKLKEEQHNVERWEKRMSVLQNTLSSLEEMDQDITLYANVLRAKKKSQITKTEMEQKKVTKEISSFDDLAEEKTKLDSGIPSVKKLDILEKELHKINKTLAEKRRRQKELKEKIKKMKKVIESKKSGGEKGGERKGK